MAGLMVVVTACASSSEPASSVIASPAPTTTTATTSPTTSTTSPPSTTQPVTTSTLAATGMLVEVRTATTEELQRLDSNGALDCANAGGATWDYGPIDDAEPRGRQATDALSIALNELNRDAASDGYEPLPLSGWTALIGERRVDFVLIEGGAWIASVRVGGDPEIGVWRHFSALLCPR